MESGGLNENGPHRLLYFMFVLLLGRIRRCAFVGGGVSLSVCFKLCKNS